ncbi:MAG TPA: DUF6064 family protein [Ramlibacter sp.]|nr:DUF6064 family protein [Ramlibacter sp.]
MPEWRSYELSDFLMFAPDTYWRLVARYNTDSWPLHLLGLGAAGLLIVLVVRCTPWASRVIAVVGALAWLQVAWGFHWQHYAQINWGARYFAAASGFQAVLLLVFAFMPGAPRSGLRVPGLLLAFAGLSYPLVAVLAGRPWQQAEVFGLMPEPTALLTLGVLIATGATRRGLLVLVPVLSLALGWTTLWLFTPE